MDIFNEWIVTKKKTGKDYAIIAGIIAALLVAIMATMLFMRYFSSFGLLIVAGLIYVAYIGITRTNIEYEYSVTNGELDIDKIISRRKRSRLVTVHSKTFEYFAPYTSEHMNAYNTPSITKKIDAYSDINLGKVYFAIYYKNNEKTRITFEPTEKMITDFERFVPRSMFFAK